MPHCCIGADVIVGFPGETEEAFQELLDFVDEQQFDRVGCFKYSPEDNTPGGRMVDQIDEETKQPSPLYYYYLQKLLTRHFPESTSKKQ